MIHTKKTSKVFLKNPKKGFTLVELMIVISIIGILTAAGIGGYFLMRPTRNFHAEGRDLVSNIQMARVEAVTRGTCVGIILQPGVYPAASYTLFVDDGAGGGTACDATINGTENSPTNTIANFRIRPEIILMPAVAGTAADSNIADRFASVSFNQRSLVAARSLAGGPFVLGNNSNVANITMWSRVVIFVSGGATLQTNNNQANEANWN